MEAYTISERKYRRKLQSESYFPVIILYVILLRFLIINSVTHFHWIEEVEIPTCYILSAVQPV